MSKMQRWICVVENNCDPGREAEFNDWHERVHVPDVLATPGYVRARRYVNREARDGRGKYMTMYDIETSDIAATLNARREREAEEARQGRSAASRPHLYFPVWRDVIF